jgi:hypothetical protein
MILKNVVVCAAEIKRATFSLNTKKSWMIYLLSHKKIVNLQWILCQAKQN